MSPGALKYSSGFEYAYQRNAYADLEYGNDVGYLPDGTALNTAGNCINHPETIQPDRHTPGSPLPRAHFHNDVGYLPDGTPLNKAGNAINHPENIQPDLHVPGSALPASGYSADVGYFVDGTPVEFAGNNFRADNVGSPKAHGACWRMHVLVTIVRLNIFPADMFIRARKFQTANSWTFASVIALQNRLSLARLLAKIEQWPQPGRWLRQHLAALSLPGHQAQTQCMSEPLKGPQKEHPSEQNA